MNEHRQSSRGTIVRLAVLLTAVATAGLLVGCGAKPINVTSEQQFEQVVNQSDQPVLMYFFKAGCATCIAMDPKMDTLAQEYKDRAVVAKYMAMNFFFVPSSSAILKKYDLAFFPTVILFDNGAEVDRWTANYDLNKYRKALDPLVPPPPATAPAEQSGETGDESGG